MELDYPHTISFNKKEKNVFQKILHFVFVNKLYKHRVKMATAITTVTKAASVVKTTKGSEKKWSEILTMNRRHDLQLPIDIAKYDQEFKTHI